MHIPRDILGDEAATHAVLHGGIFAAARTLWERHLDPAAWTLDVESVTSRTPP